MSNDHFIHRVNLPEILLRAACCEAGIGFLGSSKLFAAGLLVGFFGIVLLTCWAFVLLGARFAVGLGCSWLLGYWVVGLLLLFAVWLLGCWGSTSAAGS